MDMLLNLCLIALRGSTVKRQTLIIRTFRLHTSRAALASKSGSQSGTLDSRDAAAQWKLELRPFPAPGLCQLIRWRRQPMIVEVMSAYELLKQEKKDKPEALTFPSGHFGPAPTKHCVVPGMGQHAGAIPARSSYAWQRRMLRDYYTEVPVRPARPPRRCAYTAPCSDVGSPCQDTPSTAVRP
jgi:hypothetical protein